MLGRLCISTTTDLSGAVYIMGIPGLHLLWADEKSARGLLTEYELPEQDFRLLAADEKAAVYIVARAGYVAQQPQKTAATSLLNLWSTPPVTHPDEQRFRKPKFRDKMHGIIAAAYGVPFWKSSGLWCLNEHADYVEGKLSFDKLTGFSVLKGFEERNQLVKTASLLQSIDVEW